MESKLDPLPGGNALPAPPFIHQLLTSSGVNMKKRFIPYGLACALGLGLALGLGARSASAGVINASATWTSALDGDGVNFDYTITLKNLSTSTDPIGTFWFSWTPGQDYMANSPLSESTPAGWAALVTHGGANDGYAIQWVAQSTPADLAPGSSLTFGFKSPESPAQLAGNSPFFAHPPEGTAFLYSGPPFTGDSARIVATPAAAVPEPSTVVLGIVAGLAAFGYKQVKQRKFRKS
jgi:hypothetical protein